MQNVITKVVVAVALMGFASADKSAAANAADYDGDWTVLVTTKEGTCDRSSSYDVSVSHGHILFNSHTSVTLSGTVSPQGAVSVSIRHFDEGANGSGRLTEHTGIGGWRGAGKDGVCSGRWEAHRR
jgi:hypothetical protein